MNIGEKIKYLRLANNLTQEELADRCELSKGFISQLERNLTSPSIATLMDILSSLGTDLTRFFQEQVDEKIVFSEMDYATKQDAEMGSHVCWLVPNAQKNMMEPILLTLEPGGSTYPDNPHEGEEFGYVLEGVIQIHIGQRILKARKGDSFIIHPSEPHALVNNGKRRARVLWVSTPPSF
ncbi:MAG: helix-turn-helix transcriptional regulator [Clostridia bacterium]|nr:helix-turn-helix transcriptional regulator [Clostridia bacterium]